VEINLESLKDEPFVAEVRKRAEALRRWRNSARRETVALPRLTTPRLHVVTPSSVLSDRYLAV